MATAILNPPFHWQVYSGNRPFDDIDNDCRVLFSVTKGNRPRKPSSQSCKLHPDVATHVWNLIEDCWDQSPEKRPTAGDVVQRIRSDLQPLPHTSIHGTPFPVAYPPRRVRFASEPNGTWPMTGVKGIVISSVIRPSMNRLTYGYCLYLEELEAYGNCSCEVFIITSTWPSTRIGSTTTITRSLVRLCVSFGYTYGSWHDCKYKLWVVVWGPPQEVHTCQETRWRLPVFTINLTQFCLCTLMYF